jgi:hypothetical protein
MIITANISLKSEYKETLETLYRQYGTDNPSGLFKRLILEKFNRMDTEVSDQGSHAVGISNE